MKTILSVSHCILNSASKVAQDESELADEYQLRESLLRLVLLKNIQLLQLPCPEFLLYGSQRWGHVREQFMHPHFREECKRMLEPILLQLEEYSMYPDEFQILGIVSVEGSPSCGHALTCTGRWGGEIGTDLEKIVNLQKTLSLRQESGVFMQILQQELKKTSLNLSIICMEEAIKLLSQDKFTIGKERENK